MPLNTFLRAALSRRYLLLAVVCLAVLLSLQQDAFELFQPAPSKDRMAAELQRAEERGDLCSAANAAGVGLRGEYFSEAFLRGKVILVRIDDVVDFDSSIRQLKGNADQSLLSIRWTGWIKAPLNGSYRFHADAPNMQIWVSRKLVAGVDAAPGETVPLAAGRFYPVEVIVNRLTDSDARIRLEWTAPHGARYVVPKSLLHLPTETIATPKG
jgi:hypothetical protein